MASSKSASLSAKRQRQILAVLLGAFSLLTVASVATFHRPATGASFWQSPNACGPVGAGLSWMLAWAFGHAASFLVPVLCVLWGWNRLREHAVGPLLLKSALGVLLVFEICTLFGLAGLDRWTWSGGWGLASSIALQSALGALGSWVVAGALLLASALAASELGFHWIGALMHGAVVRPAKGAHAAYTSWAEQRAEAEKEAAKNRAKEEKDAAKDAKKKPVKVGAVVNEAPAKPEPKPAPKIGKAPDRTGDELEDSPMPSRAAIPVPIIKAPPKPAKPKLPDPPRHSGPVPTEALPPMSLLDLPQQPEDLVTAADLTAQANLLVAKLADFDIDGRVTEIHPGPVVTMFEFEPAAGNRVGSIVALEDDLALAMRANRIRVIAPLPGRGTVGVEIPNPRRRTVYLREVLSSPTYEKSDAALKIPLGVDVNGQPFVTDLTRMPHVLVAGATGAGKSVCLNSIITGLLFQHDPSTLQMVMVDPKMVELSMYNGIPHLAMPVVTEAKKAAKALRWAVGEMEKRYKLLSEVGARNINTYNERVASGKLKPAAESEEKAPERLSYVMVIVDEFADLMVQVPGEVEEPIARLAQMARAVGIHLVLATQRPSVDVITGVIKANFPSRIAFRVASKVDSRTVLDMNGAENLLGMGDMLFLPAGKAEPYRVHGAYVSEEEAVRVVDFWRAKATVAAPSPPPLATAVVLPEGDDDGIEGDLGGDDELLTEAAKLVIMHSQGSTSLLQRRLKVGYSRAGRLMDQLEQMGVVGPFNGSKAREVLVDQRWLEGQDAK
ncbi:MAG: DNA translocase FtsK [Candidatus Eisenbacteria bacterium]|nr:DNA translocase FtsK [Candidatus Eisenbacteria bacterium]